MGSMEKLFWHTRAAGAVAKNGTSRGRQAGLFLRTLPHSAGATGRKVEPRLAAKLRAKRNTFVAPDQGPCWSALNASPVGIHPAEARAPASLSPQGSWQWL